MSEDLIFEDNSGGTDIIELLKTGVPEVVMESPASQIQIYVAHDDTEEVKNAKDNIQFVVDSAREAVSFLLQLGKQTGNPRFFETVNSLLNTINGASGQLMGIDRKKKAAEAPKPSEGQTVNTQNNIHQTIVMSTSEALAEAAKHAASAIPPPVKVIDG